MANRTFSVLFYINADIAPLGLYRQHLCNSRFTDLLVQWIARFTALFDIVTDIWLIVQGPLYNSNIQKLLCKLFVKN